MGLCASPLPFHKPTHLLFEVTSVGCLRFYNCLFPPMASAPCSTRAPPHTALDEQQHGKHQRPAWLFSQSSPDRNPSPAHKHMLIICAEMMFDGCPSLLRFTAAHRCVFHIPYRTLNPSYMLLVKQQVIKCMLFHTFSSITNLFP